MAFELKNIQPVRFGITIFRHVRLLKKFAFKNSRFGSFYSVKKANFAFFVLLLKNRILIQKLYTVSKFELKEIQRVRFTSKF